MPVYVGRWRKLVYVSRFLTRLKPVNTACRHKLANPGCLLMQQFSLLTQLYLNISFRDLLTFLGGANTSLEVRIFHVTVVGGHIISLIDW